MYLTLLSQDEKEMFLELAYNIVNVDGNFSQDERSLLSTYCQEAQCSFDEKEVRPANVLADKINTNSNKRNKQIIVFELVGLAMSDGDFVESEKEMISNISKIFGINSSFLDDCEKEINRYFEFQMNLNKLVLE
jgi:tellurite resistance protein